MKDGTRVQIIPVSKLDYAEAQDDYVALASQGKKHPKQQTLSNLEASLDPDNFIRIHRSYVVNLERVSRLEPFAKDSHIVILNDGTRLPVSRAGYARLQNFWIGRRRCRPLSPEHPKTLIPAAMGVVANWKTRPTDPSVLHSC